MDNIIIEKQTVDEAVKEALEKLNAEINEVDIEILKEPSKGLLGFLGSRLAKVKVTIVDGPKQKAKNYIDTVSSYMNIEVKYNIKFELNVLKVDITEVNEKDKGILIGKRGNTLDEIQFLLSLMVNKNRQTYVRTFVNVEDYRQKREQTLRKLAKKTADKCRYYKKKIKLEPMNPYERRIIHSSLQEEKDIITYSEGNEPYRKVVIDRR